MSTPSTTDRPLRADARRNRDLILTAALRLVAEQGTEAQIADVASKAGVGVGTVYRHFPNKDVLMGELMAQVVRENAAIARESGALDDPWEAFAGFVRRCCDTMDADAAKRRLWSLVSPEAAAIAAPHKEDMIVACGEVIDRARGAGVLRQDFTIADLPGLMCGLAAVIDAPGPGDWRRMVEFALDGLRAT